MLCPAPLAPVSANWVTDFDEAATCSRLGDAYAAASDVNAARTAWTVAASILDDLHHPDAGAIHAQLRGLDGRPVPRRS